MTVLVQVQDASPRRCQIDVLKKTAELLTRDGGDHWCRGALAYSRPLAREVSTNSPQATDFCVIGAVAHAMDEDLEDSSTASADFQQIDALLDDKSRAVFGRGITFVNDGQYGTVFDRRPEDYAKIMAVIWLVIADLEGGGRQ